MSTQALNKEFSDSKDTVLTFTDIKGVQRKLGCSLQKVKFLPHKRSYFLIYKIKYYDHQIHYYLCCFNKSWQRSEGLFTTGRNHFTLNQIFRSDTVIMLKKNILKISDITINYFFPAVRMAATAPSTNILLLRASLWWAEEKWCRWRCGWPVYAQNCQWEIPELYSQLATHSILQVGKSALVLVISIVKWPQSSAHRIQWEIFYWLQWALLRGAKQNKPISVNFIPVIVNLIPISPHLLTHNLHNR